MADEDLASQEADEGAQAGAEDPPEVHESIINLAAELGWKPKDQWQGDPEAWKPADQFIRDGREMQQSATRTLKDLRDQLDRIGTVTTRLVDDKAAERDAYWQAQFDKAVQDGDTDRANTLVKERPSGQPARKGADPQVAVWIAKNEWYSTDPLAAARANEISDRLAHLPVADQLAQAERAIRKEFPEHFPKAKDPPQPNGSGPRHANPGNRAKGYADMPLESRQIADDYEKRWGIKKEDFAKSFWNDQARAQRSARA